jgi:hypothetical protein
LFLEHPIELLGDMGLVEADFGPFEDSVNLGTRMVHRLGRTYHRLKNHFGHKFWKSSMTRVKWKLVSFSLEIVLNLTQDRCTDRDEHATGSKIILGTNDGTPW